MSAPVEPRLDVDEIQGNILAGFNKDFQNFVYLRIDPGDPAVLATRQWLKNTLADQLSKTSEVAAFNRAFKEAKRLKNPPPTATWVNVAFSASCLRRLRPPAEVDEFADDAFKLGMTARAEFLGDTSDRTQPGYKANWIFGGRSEPAAEVHIVLLVASDIQADLNAKVTALLASLPAGLKEFHTDAGKTFGVPFAGHEHFGFKDGVSQPGVRGRLSAAPADFLTERTIAAGDPRRDAFGKPGQILLWPGEFVFGYERQPQDPLSLDLDSEAAAPVTPSWAMNGSYLVIRRLRQDVGAFRAFVNQLARTLGIDAGLLGAKLVGRWPSGAPIMRATTVDIPALGDDDLANNHFAFSRDTQPVTVTGHSDPHPQAAADFLGAVCPHFAHIRKVNPRDEATDLGVAQDTGARAIIRRGIPYGEHIIDKNNPTEAELAVDRGLIFACYQASIVDQFETLIRRWCNTPNLPRPGGHDPIIGQEETHGGVRRRFIDFNGRRCFMDAEWVIPTGGEYFFSPSISAIRDTLGA